MKIYELKYSVSNHYLIEGESGRILFDTGWAGTLPDFCRVMGELQIPVQSVDYVLISHFHPDHCGIAQEIADLGPRIAVMDVQEAYIHAADAVFEKEPQLHFQPIDDEKVRVVPLQKSREFLQERGIQGEILSTPGHSDDSISLCLDSGEILVGDLNPLYELPIHRGTKIAESWEKLLSLQPKTVYYGHAKKAELADPEAPSDHEMRSGLAAFGKKTNRYQLVEKIMKGIDRHWSFEKIQKKTGADPGFIEDVSRMYLTHQNVGVQGILDRIEIKGK